MKRILSVLAALCLMSTVAHAGLKVQGKGDSMRFDPSNFPANMKSNYDIMKAKCVKCHTLERTVVAITTGVAPISSGVFDRGATKA